MNITTQTKFSEQKLIELQRFISLCGYSISENEIIMYKILMDDNSNQYSPLNLWQIRIAWSLIKCGCTVTDNKLFDHITLDFANRTITDVLYLLLEPITRNMGR